MFRLHVGEVGKTVIVRGKGDEIRYATQIVSFESCFVTRRLTAFCFDALDVHFTKGNEQGRIHEPASEACGWAGAVMWAGGGEGRRMQKSINSVFGQKRNQTYPEAGGTTMRRR